MNEKMTGYILLIVGILIMVFAAVSVYLVFTKQIQPVQLFSGGGLSVDLGSLMGGLQNGLPGQKSQPAAISSDLLNQTSNLAAEVFLMGFLVSVGYKLASLGVEMLRPVTIKLKAKDGTEYQAESKQ